MVPVQQRKRHKKVVWRAHIFWGHQYIAITIEHRPGDVGIGRVSYPSGSAYYVRRDRLLPSVEESYDHLRTRRLDIDPTAALALHIYTDCRQLMELTFVGRLDRSGRRNRYGGHCRDYYRAKGLHKPGNELKSLRDEERTKTTDAASGDSGTEAHPVNASITMAAKRGAFMNPSSLWPCSSLWLHGGFSGFTAAHAQGGFERHGIYFSVTTIARMCG